MAYLRAALHTPGFVWEDPDGYMAQALRLAVNGRWHWTFDAVIYDINNQRHALPPGYSVFLSLFALFPAFPMSAQIAQVFLSVVAIALVFELGRILHSVPAGLVAAAGFAIWIPNIFNVWSTSQEALYIPLLLAAFVLLGRAIIRDSGPLRWSAAGLSLASAALTRSMPLFFVGPAMFAHIALASNRRRAAIQSVAFLAGFLALVAPYSAALSQRFGQLTVIDSHGSIHFESQRGTRAPTLGETATALWSSIAEQPLDYAAASVARGKTLLYVNGGRLLQIYVVADDRVKALVWKVLVHAGTDLILIAGVSLATIGAALSRQPRVATILLVWSAVNIAVASLGGFGGARLRAPFEPILFAMAAIVVAGDWRRPRAAWLVLSVAAAIFATSVVLPQVPRSLRAWPDYGIDWPSIFSRESGQFSGAAGFNVPAYTGAATITATPVPQANLTKPVQVGVRIGGVQSQTVYVAPGSSERISFLWPAGGFAFVELEAAPENGVAPIVRVTLPKR